MPNNTTRRPRFATASATANGRLPPPQTTASGLSSVIRAPAASIMPHSKFLAGLQPRARGRKRLWASPTSRHHGTHFGLGDHLPRHFRLAAKPPHLLFSGNLGHVVFDRVSWHDRLAELGLVDG